MDSFLRRGIWHQAQPGQGSESSNQPPHFRQFFWSRRSVSSIDSTAQDSETSNTSSSSGQCSEITEQERASAQQPSRSYSANEIYNEESIFYTSPDHFPRLNTGSYFERSLSRFSFLQRNSITGSSRSLGAINDYRIFKFAAMQAATNNFDSSLIIGKGGFGKVYKGEMVLDTREVLVAIKRWNSRLSKQTVKEFQSEIDKLSSVRHRNVVSLIGYCDENNEMILVYEYIPRGTLRSHLRRGNNSLLPWKERLRICIGAANGLHYLHTGTEQPIIHRDIKTTNILLDNKLEPKIADFGLARQGPDGDQSHVSTIVQGTWGYIDPDYWSSRKLTEMSDVFSFGVVLLEVLTGLPPTDKLLSRTFEQPLSLARLHYENKTLNKIIDPFLEQQIELKCLKTFSKTIMECIEMDRTKRPLMGTVLHNLITAKQMQEKAEKKGSSSSVWASHRMLRF